MTTALVDQDVMAREAADLYAPTGPQSLIDFMTDLCWIPGPDGEAIRFIPWPGQVALIEEIYSPEPSIHLKGRQVGGTWIWAAYLLQRLIFRQNYEGRIISLKEGEAAEVLDRVRWMYDRLPDWIRPELKTNNTTVMEVEGTDSKIKALASTDDAGRGGTLDDLLADEAANIPNLKRILRSAMPTLEHRRGKAGLLSTAEGMGNHFAELWEAAEAGRGRWKPSFLHWSIVPGRTQEWHDALEAEDPDTTHQEYPEYPRQAFLSSGSPFFVASRVDEDLLANCEDDAERGWLIDGQFIPDPQGGLLVWERPDPLARYVISGDVAEGLPKGDGTTLEVWHVSDADPRQVAEFWTRTTDPLELAAEAKVLGSWYNGDTLAVETNNMGYATNLELRRLGYGRLWYDTDEVSLKESDRPGWMTGPGNRRMMLSAFRRAHATRKVVIRSRALLREMSTFVWINGKAQGEGTNLDDRVMAAAIAFGVMSMTSRKPRVPVDEKRRMERDLGIKVIDGLDGARQEIEIKRAREAKRANLRMRRSA